MIGFPMSYPSATVLPMESVAWTAIALLGASVLGSYGAVFYLGSKIDSKIDTLGSRLDARIDAQGTDLGGRIDSLSSRIDSLETRLDSRLDALTSRIDEHIRNAG